MSGKILVNEKKNSITKNKITERNDKNKRERERERERVVSRKGGPIA